MEKTEKRRGGGGENTCPRRGGRWSLPGPVTLLPVLGCPQVTTGPRKPHLYQLGLFPIEPVQTDTTGPEKQSQDRGFSVFFHRAAPTVERGKFLHLWGFSFSSVNWGKSIFLSELLRERCGFSEGGKTCQHSGCHMAGGF